MSVIDATTLSELLTDPELALVELQARLHAVRLATEAVLRRKAEYARPCDLAADLAALLWQIDGFESALDSHNTGRSFSASQAARGSSFAHLCFLHHAGRPLPADVSAAAEREVGRLLTRRARRKGRAG